MSINDRHTLSRASEISLLITRTCGRLSPSNELARPFIALELACQEQGVLSKFSKDTAAQLSKKPLPMYMKLCDQIVNALLSNNDSNSTLSLITIEGMCSHFGLTKLAHSIHACFEYYDTIIRQFPWRCLIGATLIVFAGHLRQVNLVPMRVTEYVHMQWKDMQACVKMIKSILQNDNLDRLTLAYLKANEHTESVNPDHHHHASSTLVRKIKPRPCAYLLDGQAQGIFAHIGLNSVVKNN